MSRVSTNFISIVLNFWKCGFSCFKPFFRFSKIHLFFCRIWAREILQGCITNIYLSLCQISDFSVFNSSRGSFLCQPIGCIFHMWHRPQIRRLLLGTFRIFDGFSLRVKSSWSTHEHFELLNWIESIWAPPSL